MAERNVKLSSSHVKSIRAFEFEAIRQEIKQLKFNTWTSKNWEFIRPASSTKLVGLSQHHAKSRASSNNLKLCANCQTIDFDWIFTQALKDRSWRKVFRLWDDFTVTHNPSCPLCDLLWHLLAPWYQGKPTTTPRDITFGTGHFLAPRGYDCPILTICQESEDDMDLLLDNIPPSVMRLGCAGEARTAVTASHFKAGVRVVEPHRIDYGILRRWVRRCCQKHTQTCAVVFDVDRHTTTVGNIRLIDCHARCIVSARLGSGCMPFVALSYVWGSASTPPPPQQQQGQIPSSASGYDLLPSLLPDTIEDAIKVTKKLRYRFLWVDRYCIRQDDPVDKARQIPLMGLIYGLAQVTLIAAAGTDPSYGLPGVGRRHRKPQPRATVAGGRTLLWDLGDPKEPIEKAAWSTRGWTYQEALLSRRRLAFSDRQVYFECGTMYCCEASDVPLRITHKTERLHLVYLYPLHTVGRNAQDFTQRLSEYSKRRFGNPADVLDGLQGILRFFEQGEHPIYNLFGMPILPPVTTGEAQGEVVKPLARSLSDGFLVVLCWSLWDSARRRSMFPSWSWAGWEYDKGWLSMATTSIDVLNGETGITVALESTAGQKMVWSEFEAKLGSWDYTHSLSHILRITCGTFDFKIKYLTNRDDNVEFDGPYAKISNAKRAAAKYHWYHPLIEADKSPDRDWSSTSLLGIYIGPLDVEITDSRSLTSFILVAEKMGENYWERVGHFNLDIFKYHLKGVDRHERTAKYQLPLIWKEIRLG